MTMDAESKVVQIGEIIKSKYFALFEGTRALEVANKVLDTGLIRLSDDELTFDVAAPRDGECVLSIMTKLLGLLMTWLNTSSLPVTVLSCRYVEECLKNFDGTDLKTCNFGAVDADADDIDTVLVHKVLLSYVHGLVIFVRNVVQLGQAGVLYEEEDVTTTTMGFNFFLNIEAHDVRVEINNAIEFVNAKVCHDQELKDRLVAFLNISSCFTLINDLLEINCNVYHETIPREPVFLSLASKNLKQIKQDIEYYKGLPELPKGCISEGIQKRNDNYLPPNKNHMDPLDEAIGAAITMVQDLQTMVLVTSVKNVTQLTEFLDAFMNKRDPPSHVVARALLQLFLVRDDKSILGNPGTKFINFLVDEMAQLTCYDSKIFHEIQLGTNPELNQSLMELLTDIENTYYSYVLIVSQNPCRQRQHFNRLILVWDALQVRTEQFELEVQEKYGLNDSFRLGGDGNEETPAMPISSWVYYHKLRAMLEVCLRGVELEIYKIWELHSIFWYIEYLTNTMISHLHRIKSLWEYKKAQVASLNKKIKKQKAGEKKQQMKEQYRQKVENDVPRFDQILETIELKLFETSVVKNLAQQSKMLFTIFYNLGLLNLPKLNKIPESLSYGLKMKSFQSVGVPDFPDFHHWSRARTLMMKDVSTKDQQLNALSLLKENCTSIRSTLQDKLNTLPDSTFAEREKRALYGELVKSSLGLTVSANTLAKNLGSESIRVNIDRNGYHRSFPFFNISMENK